MVLKRLLAELRKKQNKTFLVSSHINLEGDALGSELALASLLKRLGKKVLVLNQDAAPAEYSFLPHLKSVIHENSQREYDVAVLVDCSDISRIGKITKVIKKERLIINIDHHISNTKFGDINWVEPYASCACEIVYKLFKHLKVKINKTEALLLYTGILADTGSFKYSSTSSFTHKVASELLEHKLDVYRIYRNIHESLDLKTVKAFGKIIETLKTDKDGRIAWLELRYNLIKKNHLLAEQTDQIINFARAIKGVEVALLFKEIFPRREVRVNLRSRGGVDVNQLAQVFGGGGHKMASGCTVGGPLKEVIAKVVEETRKRMR